MAKLLDLDALIPEKKTIKISGNIYTVAHMTVGLFALAQHYQTQDIASKSPVEQLHAGIELVGKLLPEMNEEQIQNLPIEFIQSIIVHAFQDGEATNEQHAGEEAK
ncbi:hypothetical protein [Xenorhabdus hominickii]|uniref:Phage protein n=1 Tax=Xenorhabdus hominickii TaxID=351679 RepID=A0A1V0M3U9_XENHO|nr:hypothetical protein [Xenorhabdus hominickii]ARD69567.1 hypothetical protein [Xenorhabdus hominickii]PHM52398.1 hypothetical protein Xhom_04476 [Xenorhabdus hominickii]